VPVGVGLAIAQFELYFKTRQTTTEYDPLPYWAQMPLNAQRGGTWLSVALFRKASQATAAALRGLSASDRSGSHPCYGIGLKSTPQSRRHHR
jgi:hypothetical protein